MPKEKYRFSVQDFSSMRDGRVLAVEIPFCESSLFEGPVLFRERSARGLLCGRTRFSRYLFATAALGGMAGSDEFGSNGDPADECKRILRSHRQFYFVGGNHDGPKDRAYLFTNVDGTACCLQHYLGNVAGRVPSKKFEQRLNRGLDPPGLHTLVTHDAPALEDDFPGQRSGNELLARFVREPEPASTRSGTATSGPRSLARARLCTSIRIAA